MLYYVDTRDQINLSSIISVAIFVRQMRDFC